MNSLFLAKNDKIEILSGERYKWTKLWGLVCKKASKRKNFYFIFVRSVGRKTMGVSPPKLGCGGEPVTQYTRVSGYQSMFCR